MKIMVIIATCLLFFTGSAISAEELIVLEAPIEFIGEDYIVINQEKYFIVTEAMNIEDPTLMVTEYWYGDKERHQTNFFTIRGVGYVDLAKTTISGNYVCTIDIVTLLQ